jgi:hypothetical protein
VVHYQNINQYHRVLIKQKIEIDFKWKKLTADGLTLWGLNKSIWVVRVSAVGEYSYGTESGADGLTLRTGEWTWVIRVYPNGSLAGYVNWDRRVGPGLS